MVRFVGVASIFLGGVEKLPQRRSGRRQIRARATLERSHENEVLYKVRNQGRAMALRRRE